MSLNMHNHTHVDTYSYLNSLTAQSQSHTSTSGGIHLVITVRKEGRTEGRKVEKLLFYSHTGLFLMVLALTLMNDAAPLFLSFSCSLFHTHWLQEVCVCPHL